MILVRGLTHSELPVPIRSRKSRGGKNLLEFKPEQSTVPADKSSKIRLRGKVRGFYSRPDTEAFHFSLPIGGFPTMKFSSCISLLTARIGRFKILMASRGHSTEKPWTFHLLSMFLKKVTCSDF